MKNTFLSSALIFLAAVTVPLPTVRAASLQDRKQQAHPPPEGWKIYPMPVDDSPDWVHANHSDREWRVRSIKGKVVIERIDLDRAAKGTPGDALPFRIKPRMGWILTAGPTPPPPPPPPGARQGSRASEAQFKPPIRQASGWFRSFEHEFGGKRVAVPVEDGWIVGFDAGEWGGELYWFNHTGTSHYQLSTDKPVGMLDADNVLSLLPYKGGVLAVQGVDHMGLDLGKVEKITRQKDGRWRADLLVNLGNAACACIEDGDDQWIVVTTERVLRLHLDGMLQPLAQAAFMGSLYPNSIARASDGVLYIGMRHFVARLIPDGQSFRVELLVPTVLPLFDPDPADDAS